MGKQLSLVPPASEMAVDRSRSELGSAAKKSRPPLPALPVGRVFPAVRDFVPSLSLRSKRIKTSAPRVLRDGDRPTSLGSVGLTRWERYRLGVDEEILKDEGIAFDYLPPTFGDCPDGPCPRFRCRHHVGIEVDGDLMKVNHPDKDVDELRETCTLRVANAGELKKSLDREGSEDEPEMKYAVMRCEEVGEILNLTPERVRQVGIEALENFKRNFMRMFPEVVEELAGR